MAEGGKDKPLKKGEVEAGTDSRPPRLLISANWFRLWLVGGFLSMVWTLSWVALICALWIPFIVHAVEDIAHWSYDLWPIL